MQLEIRHDFKFSLEEAKAIIRQELVDHFKYGMYDYSITEIIKLVDSFDYTSKTMYNLIDIMGKICEQGMFEFKIVPLNKDQIQFEFGPAGRPDWHSKYCASNSEGIATGTYVRMLDRFLFLINKQTEAFNYIKGITEDLSIKDVEESFKDQDHVDLVEFTFKVPKRMVNRSLLKTHNLL